MRAASASFALLHEREVSDPRIDPMCYSVLLEQPEQVERAIVLMHGITSSPIQFRGLADQFFARGYNVLVPRLPRHGYRNRLTTDQARLDRQEMLCWTDEVVGIGRRLGGHLTVVGLSVAGTLAAWAYATRSDVDHAIPIAPAFAPFGVPLVIVPTLTRIALKLPNLFVWWDPRVRAKVLNPAGYPRFATHPMAHAFELGVEIFQMAAQQRPRGRAVTVITNPRDLAISSRAARAVVQRWRCYPDAAVRHIELESRMGHLHDVIGPYQPGADTAYVYPLVIDAVASIGG
jgi:dienelactone hydrolase